MMAGHELDLRATGDTDFEVDRTGRQSPLEMGESRSDDADDAASHAQSSARERMPSFW